MFSAIYFLNNFQRIGNDSLALPLVSIIKCLPTKSGVYLILSIFLFPLLIKSPLPFAVLSKLSNGNSNACCNSKVSPSYSAAILAFLKAIYMYFSSPEAKLIPSYDTLFALTGPFFRVNFLFILLLGARCFMLFFSFLQI